MKQNNSRRLMIQILLLIAASAMMFYGVTQGEVGVVFTKAVNVCLECIGLG